LKEVFKNLQFYSLDLVVQFMKSPCCALLKVIKITIITAII